MQSGTVYFAQEPRMMRDPVTKQPRQRDFSSANRFGKIKFIFGTQDHPSQTPGAALRNAIKALDDFNPDTDYVCHAGGDPLALTITFLALKHLRHHSVLFLRYDKSRDLNGERTATGFYVPVTVNLEAT